MSVYDRISACLVTRGDVPMDTILASLPFTDVVVWNNAERPFDYQCYGRFAAVEEARHDWIFVQDDDLVLPVQELVGEWEASDKQGIVANIRPDEDWLLTACGAIFHRDTLGVFPRYIERYGLDRDFGRVADVVHAYQLPFQRRWVGYSDLPWQTAPNSMYLQPDHYVVRQRAVDRLQENGWLYEG